MLNLKVTHGERLSKLESLTISSAVPCQVGCTALLLQTHLRTAIILVHDLRGALDPPVASSSSTSKQSPRTTVDLPLQDVHNGLMKT